MVKYGELCDDSALVKALDDAISKYKIMHGKGGTISSPDEEKTTTSTVESESIVFNGSNEPKSACLKTEDNTTVTDIPNADQVQDTECTYVDAQTAEDYNVLLNQYNAVEEQRQKLLGQLYQYGNWDYQSYGYGGDYDSQYQQPQPSVPPVCPCSNAVSCSEDGGVIKAAMEAIEKVIQTFNTGDKEGKNGEEVETSLENMVKDKTSQTDLSVVFNAWFSAGFYTGKYLSEHSSLKK